MNQLVFESFADAQTTVTSLAAGVGGATANAIGDALVKAFDPSGKGGLGAIGLQFVARAVTSAGVFIALQRMLPQTSENVFFSILFFACNPGLMGSAQTLSYAAVSAVGRLLPTNPPAASRAVPPSVPPSIPSPPCATGKCGSSSMMY